jgi:hypothetical protein
VLVGGNDAPAIVQHDLEQILFGELCRWRRLRNDDLAAMP